MTSLSHTLRALAWLLRYPNDAMREALPDVARLFEQPGVLDRERRAALSALAVQLSRGAALPLEARYVDTFDRGRATSLNLFEHVHGESRDRGSAMVDLLTTYEAAGLLLSARELPDYLPVLLEFASTQPRAQVEGLLGEVGHIVQRIFSALIERDSPYAAVLGAVLDLAGLDAVSVQIEAEPEMDELWQEPEAFAGCSNAGQAKKAEQPITWMPREKSRSVSAGALS